MQMVLYSQTVVVFLIVPANQFDLAKMKQPGHLTAELMMLMAEDFVMLQAGHLESLLGAAPCQA